MSVDEFLDWEPGDGQAWQLVDGEPQAMFPAKRTHGALQGELSRLVQNHFVEQGGPCSVVVAPGVVPHVQASFNMRVPDLAVTCIEYEVEEAALSNPVLIVEILSPSNQAEAWSNVWTYTTIPSVQEILGLFQHQDRRRPVAPAQGRLMAAGAGTRHRRRPGPRKHRLPDATG